MILSTQLDLNSKDSAPGLLLITKMRWPSSAKSNPHTHIHLLYPLYGYIYLGEWGIRWTRCDIQTRGQRRFGEATDKLLQTISWTRRNGGRYELWTLEMAIALWYYIPTPASNTCAYMVIQFLNVFNSVDTKWYVDMSALMTVFGKPVCQFVALIYNHHR